ncbi:MAG: transporter ATP-binding protein [Solirubrobacterales bacterium]|nr:transporter ATP-binding protein [Solirubrobacterales bacterium]
MRRLSLLLVLLSAAVPATAGAAYTPKTLHFGVKVGPKGEKSCDIVADLYKPDGASAANPAAAILATNGFGGSKDDFKALAESYRQRGYVFLAYSGLGFGGSGCEIYLDDRDWDGRAAKQLVSFLGGQMHAKDGTGVDYVIHDATDHAGTAQSADPRVGMIGGSYGGEIQFAAAGIDPRIDAIVPQITWNDLSYSLAPNNTSQTKGVTYATPGTEKFDWVSLFFTAGMAVGVQNNSVDPSRNNPPCPNFADQACTSKAWMDATGYPDQATLDFARHASVSTYIDKIKIPTLLAQGQGDTLFNLNEAVATYDALRAQNTPVKMLWRSEGHSGGDLGTSENNPANPESAYESRMELEWLDYYLRGIGDAPALDFSFFRDWVTYKGDAQPAVASSPTYPAAGTRSLFLSGTDALVADKSAVKAGSAQFAVPPAGAPTSHTEVSGLDQSIPITDAQGTFAAFSSAPLAADTDVAGIPKVTFSLDAPIYAQTSTGGPGGQLVLFVKLYDVNPADGSIVLPHRLIAPIRVADPTKPVTVALPGIVHRFAKGHVIRLMVAAGDSAYKGNAAPGPVAVTVDPAKPSELALPVLSAPVTGPAPAVQPAGSGQMPSVAEEGRQTTAASLPTPAKSCKKNRRVITIHFTGVKKPDRIISRKVTINGKRIKAGHGKTLKISLKKRKAGTYRIYVLVKSKKGKVRRTARTYKVC